MKKFTNFVAILMVSTMLQSQTTIFVKSNGTGDGTSWTNACNLETAVVSTSLNDQTQIWVQKGTHYPTKMLVIPASVKIYGGFSGTENNLSERNLSANPTIIDGQQKIGGIFRLGKSAELHDLTIQHGNANGTPHKNGGGIWADDNAVIENCIIQNNSAIANGGGIYAKGVIKIIGCIVKQNTAQGDGNNTFGNCMELDVKQSGIATGIDIAGCNGTIPDFGEISFKTENTWTIPTTDGSQVWSDAVMASGCNKTWYNGGNLGNFSSDCRANSDRSLYGDLFSWCAVARFAHVLCPAPWRVPTVEDFGTLDKALGGYGDGSGPGDSGTDIAGKLYNNATIAGYYLSMWGNAYGSICSALGELVGQGMQSEYWTQSMHSPERGFYGGEVAVHSPWIRPQGYHDKFHGFALRCVK